MSASQDAIGIAQGEPTSAVPPEPRASLTPSQVLQHAAAGVHAEQLDGNRISRDAKVIAQTVAAAASVVLDKLDQVLAKLAVIEVHSEAIRDEAQK